MKYQRYILDNGIQININKNQARFLVGKDMIYYCKECGCYHINDDASPTEINAYLN
jgi:hypothetical protein